MKSQYFGAKKVGLASLYVVLEGPPPRKLSDGCI